MKKYLYLFICLTLAACGSQSTSNISSDTSKTAISKLKGHCAIHSFRDRQRQVRPERTACQIQERHCQGGILESPSGPGCFRSSRASRQFRTWTVSGCVRGSLLKTPSSNICRTRTWNTRNRITSGKAASAEVIPNDTYFNAQWPLRNTGYAYGTVGADIDATNAWRVSKGNYGIVIAVLDTGVDYNHVDLSPNMWRNEAECSKGQNGIDDDGNGFVDDCAGWDFVTCEAFDSSFNCISPITGDNNPMDEEGHGTHVAGIIGAVGNNSIGISGVMWNVLLMPVRVLGAEGGTDADIINGLEYAMDMGAKVINASFGGYGESVTLSNAFQEAADTRSPCCGSGWKRIK